MSTLSNGEKTTATITGKAIVGYRGTDLSTVEIEELVIPDDVVIIGNDAFQNCIIHKLTLGSNVKAIGDSAFGDSSDFDTVSLPQTLRYIGAQAFFSADTFRTFYLNDGKYQFTDRMRFGTPDPFGKPEIIEITEGEADDSDYREKCKDIVLKYVDEILHGE